MPLALLLMRIMEDEGIFLMASVMPTLLLLLHESSACPLREPLRAALPALQTPQYREAEGCRGGWHPLLPGPGQP